MGFPNSMQSSTSPVIVAGSFNNGLTTVRGDGFSVSESSRTYTITFDREYDGIISATATLLNATPAGNEAISAVIKSHSVTADTAGGSLVIHLVDDAAAIDANTADIEVHFIAILSRDT